MKIGIKEGIMVGAIVAGVASNFTFAKINIDSLKDKDVSHDQIIDKIDVRVAIGKILAHMEDISNGQERIEERQIAVLERLSRVEGYVGNMEALTMEDVRNIINSEEN